MIANYGYEDGSGFYYISIDGDVCAQCDAHGCVAACPQGVYAIEMDPEEHQLIVENARRFDVVWDLAMALQRLVAGELAKQHVEHRRQEQAERRHADHSGEGIPAGLRLDLHGRQQLFQNSGYFAVYGCIDRRQCSNTREWIYICSDRHHYRSRRWRHGRHCDCDRVRWRRHWYYSGDPRLWLHLQSRCHLVGRRRRWGDCRGSWNSYVAEDHSGIV